MATVYLRSASAPAGTYSTLNRVLTHAELDNNMSLFLRNDESDTMLGNLYINNSSPTIFLQDTDNRSGVIHQNGNFMYFLRGDGTNGTSWAQYDSYWPLTLNLENNTATFGGQILKRNTNVPALHIQDTAPTPYNDGDMWWESDTGKLKIRYNDGSSTQWVDAFPIPDMTTYYSKAGGAISGAVTINSSLTTTGRIFADNGITLSQGGTLASGLVITNSDIRSNAASAWTGDPGTQGKIQYHANRWYIVADSSSDRIVQFRRNGTDVSYVDNSGNYVGGVTGNVSGTAATVTARTLTIGNTGKSVNHSADVSWSLSEIGAYAATNPNGYTSNAGTVTSVAGTGTVSGITLSGTVTGSGNITLGGTFSASIDAITDEHRIFNNMGDNHSTRTSFDSSTPSYNFGWRFVQGNTNSPGVNSASQYYSLYVGLGNEYPATGAGSYGMQIAIPRNVTTPYIAVRYNESNSLAGWQKISAGYADSAGTASTASSATTADQIDGVEFRNTNQTAVNADNIDSNGITYYSAGVTNFTGNASDGALYSHYYSSSWQHQIAGDFRSGQIAVRGKNSGTWQSWKIIATNARVFAQNLILG